MNRLQKKCFLASGLTHGLLLGLLVVGSAFISPKPKEELPVLHLFALPEQVVDELVQGGGEPDAFIPPGPENVEPEAPVKPSPIPVIPEPKPELPAPEPKPVTPPKPAPAPEISKPKPVEAPEPKPKPAITVNLNPVKKNIPVNPPVQKETRKEREAKAKADAAAAQVRWAEARTRAVTGTLSSLKGSMSSGTKIGIPGPGGASYAHYGSVLQKIYHDAWITPNESISDESDVDVQVTISREGFVLDHKILRKSGQPLLDKSVLKVLERVKKVPAFPEGATDEKRIFNIIFNLKAGRKLG